MLVNICLQVMCDSHCVAFVSILGAFILFLLTASIIWVREGALWKLQELVMLRTWVQIVLSTITLPLLLHTRMVVAVQMLTYHSRQVDGSP